MPDRWLRQTTERPRWDLRGAGKSTKSAALSLPSRTPSRQAFSLPSSTPVRSKCSRPSFSQSKSKAPGYTSASSLAEASHPNPSLRNQTPQNDGPKALEGLFSAPQVCGLLSLPSNTPRRSDLSLPSCTPKRSLAQSCNQSLLSEGLAAKRPRFSQQGFQDVRSQSAPGPSRPATKVLVGGSVRAQSPLRVSKGCGAGCSSAAADPKTVQEYQSPAVSLDDGPSELPVRRRFKRKQHPLGGDEDMGHEPLTFSEKTGHRKNRISTVTWPCPICKAVFTWTGHDKALSQKQRHMKLVHNTRLSAVGGSRSDKMKDQWKKNHG